eukprot:PITA_22771
MIDLVETEPSSFEEATEQLVCVDAMMEEYKSIVNNSVWEVVPRPTNKSVVRSRRIFKVKHAANGSIEKCKAGSVAKEYSQLIESCKEDFARQLEMKDMGLMNYFLKLEVWQRNGELFVSQGKYANEILQRFYMDSCKLMETPLATNWRKEDVTSGEEVDVIVYR